MFCGFGGERYLELGLNDTTQLFVETQCLASPVSAVVIRLFYGVIIIRLIVRCKPSISLQWHSFTVATPDSKEVIAMVKMIFEVLKLVFEILVLILKILEALATVPKL